MAFKEKCNFLRKMIGYSLHNKEKDISLIIQYHQPNDHSYRSILFYLNLLAFKEKCNFLRKMIGYSLHNKEEDMSLIILFNIMSQMTIPTGPYSFIEIFHNQIAKWLPYVLDGPTNSNFKI